MPYNEKASVLPKLLKYPRGVPIAIGTNSHTHMGAAPQADAFNTSDSYSVRLSTQEEIRTPTPIQAPAPQAGASTNSATWVFTIQSFPKASTIPIAIGIATWVSGVQI